MERNKIRTCGTFGDPHQGDFSGIGATWEVGSLLLAPIKEGGFGLRQLKRVRYVLGRETWEFLGRGSSYGFGARVFWKGNIFTSGWHLSLPTMASVEVRDNRSILVCILASSVFSFINLSNTIWMYVPVCIFTNASFILKTDKHMCAILTIFPI